MSERGRGRRGHRATAKKTKKKKARAKKGAGGTKGKLLSGSSPTHLDVSGAIVIKDGPMFFLCERGGGVPCDKRHGIGLFYRDCRYLSGVELKLAGRELEALGETSADGFRAAFELANPKIEGEKNEVKGERIVVRWRHVIDSSKSSMYDDIEITNFDTKPHELPMTLRFAADLADVFVVRGVLDRDKEPASPRWDGEGFVFAKKGIDGVTRSIEVRFSAKPAAHHGGEARFDLALAPHEKKRLVVSYALARSDGEDAARPDDKSATLQDAEHALGRSLESWLQNFASVETSDDVLDRVMTRSLHDLRALRTKLEGLSFFAGGIPWFGTLFGRDSILCALETLAYRPQIAAETLRLLAQLQGKKFDDWRDEEPGKMLHELRTGELARAKEIPHTPYYGSVDSTALFLMLLCEYVRWTGDVGLFDELRGPVDAALEFIDRQGDYVAYASKSPLGLINQGWKDSGDAIVNADGGQAKTPIALVEVQAYVFRVKHQLADLFALRGDKDRAQRLREQAEALRERFMRDYWMEEKGTLALALAGEDQHKLEVLTSNAGHALWCGILDHEHARRVKDVLFGPDLYSGWGVRTLGAGEKAYNPVGYHLGTVWPHDNAIIASGLCRYGYREDACRIFADLLAAAQHFPHDRLPEVFAGVSRDEIPSPVSYPVACHPQAWAAASVPYLLQTTLGLEPDALQGVLRVVKPALPKHIRDVAMRAVRIGDAEVDLRFARNRDGELEMEVEATRGKVRIEKL